MKKLSKIIAILLLASCCFVMPACSLGDAPSTGGNDIENGAGNEDPSQGDQDDSTGNEGTEGDGDDPVEEPDDGVNGGNWTGEVPFN